MTAAACLAAGPPTAPRLAPPPGAVDCHLHVLGPFDRFALAPSRPYEPAAAPFEALQAMLDRMGIARAVVAHVSAHGSDLSVTLDAMSRLGPRARGIAILGPEVDDQRLDELHALGMRGIRLSGAYRTGTPIDADLVLSWAERIARLGWHIAMWPSSLAELQLVDRLAPRLPVPVVLDHLASHAWFDGGVVDPEGLSLLHGLLATDRVWLKLSGMYRAAPGPSPWPALVPPVRRLMQSFPSRMLWASDWPFVGLQDSVALPASGELLDWLAELGADAGLRRQILVRNPEQLYGFAAWEAAGKGTAPV